MGMASACASGAPSAVRALVRTFARFSVRISPGPPLPARIDQLRSLLRILAVVLGVAGRLEAQENQSWAERLGIDKLKFTALGVQLGRVAPYGIEPTTSYSLQADYGEIAPG